MIISTDLIPRLSTAGAEPSSTATGSVGGAVKNPSVRTRSLARGPWVGRPACSIHRSHDATRVFVPRRRGLMRQSNVLARKSVTKAFIGVGMRRSSSGR
ncbi:hypothetical protein HYQ46_009413 [Verticillium longisporum]|nr:hypothetical protein HYQ46_009413 [Verticillium longisporum]